MIQESEQDTDEDSLRIDCPVLVTERLVLRPPREDDVPELAALAGSRRIAEMLSRMPHPYGEREATAFVANVASGSHDGCTYAVALADNGAFIGCAGLHRRARGLELGFWFGEPYWGRGYATETAHALVDLAFRATTVDAVHASCRVINTASRRVIHKCGFQYSGQGMMVSLAAGRVPVELYGLDRSTWASLRTWSSTGTQ